MAPPGHIMPSLFELACAPRIGLVVLLQLLVTQKDVPKLIESACTALYIATAIATATSGMIKRTGIVFISLDRDGHFASTVGIRKCVSSSKCVFVVFAMTEEATAAPESERLSVESELLVKRTVSPRMTLRARGMKLPPVYITRYWKPFCAST